jgi:putative DNA primase/helicase
MIRAADIAAQLGATYRSGLWWRCVCPVHGSRSGRSLSLALRDHPRGLAVRCHAGCSRDDVIAELRRMGLLAGHSEGARPALIMPRSNDAGAARRTALAQRIWDSAHDARGTPVAQYLAARGITLPVPRVLRYAPSLRRPDGTHAPAVVARVDGLDGELIGVHRTWLDRDGAGMWHRRDRASLGPIGGGAARLASAAETLMIGEGIETVMAAMTAAALPGWAALSTPGMVALVLPPIVRTAVVVADNDPSGAGEKAAHAAAHRWRCEGRHISIWMSPHVGEDAADRLLAEVGEACNAA